MLHSFGAGKVVVVKETKPNSRGTDRTNVRYFFVRARADHLCDRTRFGLLHRFYVEIRLTPESLKKLLDSDKISNDTQASLLRGCLESLPPASSSSSSSSSAASARSWGALGSLRSRVRKHELIVPDPTPHEDKAASFRSFWQQGHYFDNAAQAQHEHQTAVAAAERVREALAAATEAAAAEEEAVAAAEREREALAAATEAAAAEEEALADAEREREALAAAAAAEARSTAVVAATARHDVDAASAVSPSKRHGRSLRNRNMVGTSIIFDGSDGDGRACDVYIGEWARK